MMLWPILLAMSFNWANVLIFDRKFPCYLYKDGTSPYRH